MFTHPLRSCYSIPGFTTYQIFSLTLLLCVFMQPLTVDIHYYYILELSFYLSLLFSHFTDIRRKVIMSTCHKKNTHHACPVAQIIICLLEGKREQGYLLTYLF